MLKAISYSELGNEDPGVGHTGMFYTSGEGNSAIALHWFWCQAVEGFARKGRGYSCQLFRKSNTKSDPVSHSVENPKILLTAVQVQRGPGRINPSCMGNEDPLVKVEFGPHLKLGPRLIHTCWQFLAGVNGSSGQICMWRKGESDAACGTVRVTVSHAEPVCRCFLISGPPFGPCIWTESFWSRIRGGEPQQLVRLGIPFSIRLSELFPKFIHQPDGRYDSPPCRRCPLVSRDMSGGSGPAATQEAGFW